MAKKIVCRFLFCVTRDPGLLSAYDVVMGCMQSYTCSLVMG